MADVTLFEEDFERYVIGFTENQYFPGDSPTPGEHGLGYITFSQDYAERSNRGKHKRFLDHSGNLDKKKRQSVTKINHNILDLMFELSERRKLGTPLFTKSAMATRSDSRHSDSSEASFKTSSSLPLIEVQQLPPLMQSYRSFPSLRDEFYQFPGIEDKPIGKTGKSRKKQKQKNENDKEKMNDNKEISANKQNNKQNKSEETKVKEIALVQSTNEKKEANIDTTDGVLKPDKNKENNTRINEEPNSDRQTVYKNKWKIAAEKVLARNKISRGISDLRATTPFLGNYRQKPKSLLSFCQSSYQERAEKERMNNIRRRHASQTKVGPLDFNKLRRQITMGRSKTTMF